MASTLRPLICSSTILLENSQTILRCHERVHLIPIVSATANFIIAMAAIQSANVDHYLESLSEYNVNALWTVMEAAVGHHPMPLTGVNISQAVKVPPRPAPKAIPFIWEYQRIRPKLVQAAEMVPVEHAERRVLMLTNPALCNCNSTHRPMTLRIN